MVEHSLGTARSGAAAGRSKGVAKPAGSVFKKLETVTQRPAASDAASTRGATAAISTASGTPGGPDAGGEAVNVASPCADDPDAVAPGAAYEQLLAKCGAPSLKTTGADGGEILYFSGKNGEIAVTMAAGVVKSVSPRRPAADSKPTAVVIIK